MSVSHPQVSIITPLHNSAAYIAETINSVLAQTFQDWEMIIVDDKSSDDSVSIVEHLIEQEPRITLVKLNENSGAAVARNNAIDLAKGRYIAFLDADDLWLPEKLEKQLAFMREAKAAFSFTAYQRINEHGEKGTVVGVPSKISYGEMLKTSVIGCLTAIYDTQTLGKVKMPLIRKRQDYALWLQLLKKTPLAYGMQTSLALYRVHEKSISSNKLNTATYNWTVYRELEKLNLIQSCYYFSHYALRGILRSKLPRLAKTLGVME